MVECHWFFCCFLSVLISAVVTTESITTNEIRRHDPYWDLDMYDHHHHHHENDNYDSYGSYENTGKYGSTGSIRYSGNFGPLIPPPPPAPNPLIPPPPPPPVSTTTTTTAPPPPPLPAGNRPMPFSGTLHPSGGMFVPPPAQPPPPPPILPYQTNRLDMHAGPPVYLVQSSGKNSHGFSSWLVPFLFMMAFPFITGAAFIPLFLKSIVYLLQIGRNFGILFPLLPPVITNGTTVG